MSSHPSPLAGSSLASYLVLSSTAVSTVSLASSIASGTKSTASKEDAETAPTFLSYAPPHYTAHKLRQGETITIDGKLDDAAWADASWTSDIVDITDHLFPHNGSVNKMLNAVPDWMQLKCKLRWDDDFLYIGALLQEPYVRADVPPGDNSGKGPPYHDNDFEVFIDVSGTTQYYKEYEMSARNATYNVLWGVPDLMVPPLSSVDNYSVPNPGNVPIRVNTSSPFYPGSWTMFDAADPSVGLHSATSYNPSTFGKYALGNTWSAEIAFPLDSSYRQAAGGEWVGHGGLLDAGPPYAGNTFKGSRADPREPRRQHHSNNNQQQEVGTAAATSSEPPVYWHIDLSRAEHPRRVVHKTTGETRYCPFDCPTDDVSNWHVDPAALNSTECQAVLDKYPTLLGIHPWSCYWEWAVASVGPYAYMHRPLYWMTMQMAGPPSAVAAASSVSSSHGGSVDSIEGRSNDDRGGRADDDVTCRDIEWPGRYLGRTLFEAQQVVVAETGRYADDTGPLLKACASFPPKCGRDATANLNHAFEYYVVKKMVTDANATFQIQMSLNFTAHDAHSRNAPVDIQYDMLVNEQDVVKIVYPDDGAQGGGRPNACL